MPQIDKSKLPKEITDKYSIANNAFSLSKIKNSELDIYKNEPKDEINLIVGDDKVPDTFIPQIKFERFSNEVNFSIRLIDDEVGVETVNTLADKIVWEKDNKKIEFYDFVEDEGGYKLVWFLKKKPKTNKVSFTMQSKSLDFFRQPALTEEFQNGYSEEFKREIVVTETDVKDLEGNVLVHRPIDVVGSYVFYHQTKGGMVDKFGKDYKTGKAFHIYRPHLFDSNGAEAWGMLHIENGIYSVEIPQEFLDNAVYPIKSNDTFGYTTIGATNTSLMYNSIRSWIYAPPSAGTVTKISFYTKAYGGDTIYLRGVVYLNSSLALITNGAELSTASTSYAWRDLTLTSASISAVNHRIGVWIGSNGIYGPYYAYDAGLTMYRDNYNYHATNAPVNPLVDDESLADRKASFYATYTPSGGGGAATPLLTLMGVGT